jgi:uncharacterized protein (DUF1501 family)
MKRRSFVQSVALSSIGAPLLLKDFKFGAITKQLFRTSRTGEDRVLVIIRMNGGNDGLNTVIPLDQYDNLVIQRPNVLIPENQLISLNTTNALHPAMTGMGNLFGDGKLSVVQNVGYPEQNRSHFRSMDIWSTGLLDPAGTTGWLGRHLDQNYPNFPEDYPSPAFPDPFAISMGYEVSSTCQGLMGNFSHTVANPFDTVNLQESALLNDGTYYGSHMEYLSTMIAQANEYGAAVNAAANNGNTLSTLYDTNNDLAVQLRYVAQMISGGLQTKIYIVNINGFDTHDAQVVDSAPETGNHAFLLKSVSDAIAAFQDDLALLGLEQRVAGMTFSEFGRQVASNASFGTDHGDAAPLFLFGTCISSQIVGPNPVIGDQIQDQAGVPMQIDFRDVYASILKDWFGADPADIQAMFEHTVNFMPLLDGCSLGVGENEAMKDDVIVFPNPCAGQTTIRLRSKNERVTVQVRDLFNRLIVDVCSKSFGEGQHDIAVELGDIPSGEYLVTVMKDSGNFTKRIVKVKHI